MVHQNGVDHGGLIHDQEVAVERVFIVLLESSFLNAVLQQTMDGLGLVSGSLAHPLRGPPGGSSQHDIDPEP